MLYWNQIVLDVKLVWSGVGDMSKRGRELEHSDNIPGEDGFGGWC